MAPYPNQSEIYEWFEGLANGDTSAFFAHVSPNVIWDVLGDHPCAGHFTSLEAWKKGALAPINAVLQKPLLLKVRNIVGGNGQQEWATVELQAAAVCKNGKPYHQEYAWVCRFDEHGTIVQVRAYLDSASVKKAIEENS